MSTGLGGGMFRWTFYLLCVYVCVYENIDYDKGSIQSKLFQFVELWIGFYKMPIKLRIHWEILIHSSDF